MTGDVAALMSPRNVVIVGASDRNWSPRIWTNLRRFGFAGRVFPVNPTRSEIWGEKCFPDLRSLPEPPDHLALLIPRDQTLETLEIGGKAGARSATLFAAGFGEGDEPEGRVFAARLHAALRKWNIAAVGPNCMGLAVGGSGLCTFPDEQLEPMSSGELAVLTQSGMLGQTFCRGLVDAGLSISCLISCGNQIGLTFPDYIDHLAENPMLRVIVCYIESVADAASFFASAERARLRGKQLIVVKAGGSKEARAASIAHTGSLAGDKKAFDAFAERFGVLSVDALEDVVEAAVYFSKMPLPSGNGVGVMTNSGALKTLATDAAQAFGLKLPKLGRSAASRIGDVLPDASPGNPLDTKRTLSTEEYIACLQTLHDDPALHMLLLAEERPREAGIPRKERNAAALDEWIERSATKPIVVFSPLTLHETAHMRAMRRRHARAPMLRDLSKTIRVISKIAALGASQKSALGSSDWREARLSPAAEWMARAQRLSRPVALDEADSKKLLRQYEIDTPDELVVESEAETVAAADRIGYPLVLKAISSDAPHKTESGLVFLQLRSRDEVRAAATTIKARCLEHKIALRGYLVAKQISGGLEVAVGLHRDAEMGLVVVAALGGVWVELLDDAVFMPPAALTVSGAVRKLKTMRSFKLFSGFRGSAPLDVDALAACLVNLARMGTELGDCLEAIDVNPLLVLPNGEGVRALDGLVVLRPPSRRRLRTARQDILNDRMSAE